MKQLAIPESWEVQQAAGEDWLRGFRKRAGNISLRHPESTSLARTMGFNRIAVNAFFENLKEVLFRGLSSVPPQNIFNLDETGMSTVVSSGKVLAEKGMKQVSRISSAERGVNVTMCCCISATGHALPPVYIFPRVHFQDRMLKGAPPGSLGLACHSGWMNSELFPQALAHFIEHMNISKSKPGVLLMDNHISHVSIEAIDIAKENGLSLLTFPPHCSHKLQPLDVCVYGPFKKYYGSFVDSWLSQHGGRPVTIYETAELSGQAFARAFTIENIVSSFRATGIYPFNPDIFTDDVFLPSIVTDIPLEESTSANNLSHGIEAADVEIDDETLLTSILPYPRVSSTAKRSTRRKSKTTIITDTPEKEKILSQRKKKLPVSSNRAKVSVLTKRAQQLSSSSDSDLAMSLHSDTEYDEESSSAEDSDYQERQISEDCGQESLADLVKVGDHIIVKVFTKGNRHRNFIAVITDGPDDDGDFDVKYMKHSQKITGGFLFPEEDDLASVKGADIVRILSAPIPCAATKRLSGIFKFEGNLAHYGL